MKSTSLALFTIIVASVLVAQLRPLPHTEQARQAFLHQFAAAALDRTQYTVRYDPAYVRLPYPGGDVPADTGVCTDEVIRAYRAVGIDLQKEVHEDMGKVLQVVSRVALSTDLPLDFCSIVIRDKKSNCCDRVLRSETCGCCASSR